MLFALLIVGAWLIGCAQTIHILHLSLRLQRAAFKRLRWAMPPQATTFRLFLLVLRQVHVFAPIAVPLFGWYTFFRPRRLFICYGAMASFRLDNPIGEDIDSLCRVVWGWENGWEFPLPEYGP